MDERSGRTLIALLSASDDEALTRPRIRLASMRDDTRVEWREWGTPAFDEARRRGAPVLLSLSATWCGACHRMDAETYAEPRIAANVNDGFVPVRVDVDRRPRVRERYNMGGFPSTVFCTPGGKILTGAGYLGPDGMRQVLDSVREMWDGSGAEAGRVPRSLGEDPTPAGEVSPVVEELVAGQLTEKFDEQFAGWGTDAKFPLPRTVEFALKRERGQALRTLDAVRDHLFDEVVGGFFRFAEGRDWGQVHREKTLDTNAALVRAFANGYLYSGEDAYRRPAEETVGFLVDDLWTGRAFGGSVGPASERGREYYALSAEERAAEPSPRVDYTEFAGGNALAADALLTYHAYTDDDRAGEYADRTLRFLASDLVDDGVVTRYRDGDDVGAARLLDDQARTLAAFVRAAQVRGERLDDARAVADATLALQTDGGAFRDAAPSGAGLLDRPLRPLDGNVEVADALVDLWALTGERRYRDAARDAVAAFAGAADRIGVQVAGYGGVAARLCRDPLVVETPEPGSDLHRAACRVADHEKVLVPGDRSDARVRVGDDERRAATPGELMDAVAALSRVE
jgi:hypothetical protein